MQFTAEQIAAIIGGKTEGSSGATVRSFGKIEEAGPGQLSFLANPKYEDHLYNTKASIVIINDSLVLREPVSPTLIRVPDAYSAFAKLLETYQQLRAQQLSGIQQPSFIHETAQTGADVFIGAFAYLGEQVRIGNHVKIFPGSYIGNNVTIGDDSVIHPGVKIYHDCVIGSRVVIHAGTVIGSDGFGFAPQEDGSFRKVPQIGNVVIEDHVEIGANVTVDRATIGSTIIRSGSILDNLIQVAHNVEIGNNTAIAAQTGVSGSAKIGKNVMIGGQTGIAGHIQIADGTKISGQSGVTKSINIPNTSVMGTPAYDYTSALRSRAISRNLPDLERRIRELEAIIRQLGSKER